MSHRLALLALLGVTPSQAAVLPVGPGLAFPTLQQAEQAAEPGDVLRLSAGHHAECAVISRSDLTIEGSGPANATVLDGVACQGKAALVTQGARITVRHLTLSHIRVPDQNGAGIRAEGTDLLVEDVRFEDNQDGILAAPNEASTITIRNSAFLRNGVCNPVCAHAIYANRIHLLQVQNSQFLETFQGHHIKSRALSTEVTGCDLADGPNGRSSFQIELPNGGDLLARGNRIEKGPLSDNRSAVILVGAEGVTNPTRTLLVADNSFRLDGGYATTFVRNLSRTSADVVGNSFEGRVVPLSGPGRVR